MDFLSLFRKMTRGNNNERGKKTSVKGFLRSSD